MNVRKAATAFLLSGIRPCLGRSGALWATVPLVLYQTVRPAVSLSGLDVFGFTADRTLIVSQILVC